MISLYEPQWSIDLMNWLNSMVYWSDILSILVPILSDIFVFTYPLVLVVRYLIGVYRESMVERVQSLSVLFSIVFATLISMSIKLFTIKERPEAYVTNQDSLMLEHLPTHPFPSDHAQVSMAFGVAIILLWYSSKNTFLYYMWWFYILASVIMSISRVSLPVHWPLDIIAWRLVGSIWSLIVVIMVHNIATMYLYQPLIRLQQYFLKR